MTTRERLISENISEKGLKLFDIFTKATPSKLFIHDENDEAYMTGLADLLVKVCDYENLSTGFTVKIEYNA